MAASKPKKRTVTIKVEGSSWTNDERLAVLGLAVQVAHHHLGVEGNDGQVTIDYGIDRSVIVTIARQE